MILSGVTGIAKAGALQGNLVIGQRPNAARVLRMCSNLHYTKLYFTDIADDEEEAAEPKINACAINYLRNGINRFIKSFVLTYFCVEMYLR